MGKLCVIIIFFSIWVLFHEHLRITGPQEKGEGISLTPHYHFHPLHRHSDISRTITAEISPLHTSRYERKSLTTKGVLSKLFFSLVQFLYIFIQRSSVLRSFDLRSFVLRPVALRHLVLCCFGLRAFVPAPFCPAFFWTASLRRRAFALRACVSELQ